MKWIALTGLLALAACDRAAPPPQKVEVSLDPPKPADAQTENLARAMLNSKILMNTESVCINGVVYYASTSNGVTTLTPAFAQAGHGTFDCDGGIKVPAYKHYEPIK